MSDLNRAVVFFLLAVSFIIMPDTLMAQVTMGEVMCNAALMVTGEIGAAIATLGICTIGLGACFGKISWPMAASVSAGIGGLFGAQALAGLFGAYLPCKYTGF